MPRNKNKQFNSSILNNVLIKIFNLTYHIEKKNKKETDLKIQNFPMSNQNTKRSNPSCMITNFMQMSIFKKIKTEMGVWEEKKKQYQTLSND